MVKCKDCKHFLVYGWSLKGFGYCGITLPEWLIGPLKEVIKEPFDTRIHEAEGCDLGAPKSI